VRFRYAHGNHPDWSVATEECLLNLQAFAGNDEYARNANLGFLYLTDGLAPHAEKILATLKSRTGIPNWVGASGVGICATGVEYVDEPALAVMLASFTPGSINVFSGVQRPPTLGTRTDSGADAAFTALVHADPHTHELPELLHDMARKVSSGYLFGGLASGRGQPLQIADRVLDGGLSGVVFASDVKLVSRVSQGVHPLSGAGRHEVTRADANLILELDGRPAFDVLLEDAGIFERASALSSAAGLREEVRENYVRVRAQLQALGRRGLFVGIEPASNDAHGAYRERTPHADYVVRHVVALDPAKRLVATAAQIEQGQVLSFCTRDEPAARKDLIRICAEIRDHLHEHAESAGGAVTAAVTAKGAVYVSCQGRGSHMFGEQSEELRVIQSQLGDLPLVGFYANGEIGRNNLYGFTGVLTVFY
jgi:small ligand-binding sensory domain FIST